MKTIYTHETLIGKRFNGLSYHGNFRRVNSIPFATWTCVCGNQTEGRVADVVSGKKKSCNCFTYRRKSSHYLWKGCGEISGDYWNKVVLGARSRKMDVSITIKEAWQTFLDQDGRCALSGDPITFGGARRSRNMTASLDRIDSAKGYVKGNVQWIHKDLNRMKMDLPESTFKEWCAKVTRHQTLCRRGNDT